jgi:glucosamine kinase
MFPPAAFGWAHAMPRDAAAPYLLGVDGGGSGCRVVLADASGVELARASGAAAALSVGAERAWAAILAACHAAFGAAGLPVTVPATPAAGVPDHGQAPACVMALGLAGVNHPQWRADFLAHAPPLLALLLDSDAYTTVLGAHGGAPGVVIALGTGSIGAVLQPDGVCRTVGGYGFPAGDEASGAWLGLHALQYAQYALDGRAPRDEFAQALHQACGLQEHSEPPLPAQAQLAGAAAGGRPRDARDQLVEWMAAARQADYAQLAPVVLAHREHPFVARCLRRAGEEIGLMISALDPRAQLPVALAGGLGAALREVVPSRYRERLRAPLADSAGGALLLARRHLHG